MMMAKIAAYYDSSFIYSQFLHTASLVARGQDWQEIIARDVQPMHTLNKEQQKNQLGNVLVSMVNKQIKAKLWMEAKPHLPWAAREKTE